MQSKENMKMKAPKNKSFQNKKKPKDSNLTSGKNSSKTNMKNNSFKSPKDPSKKFKKFKKQRNMEDGEKNYLKRKSEEAGEQSPKKVKLCEMKFKERKDIRKKTDKKSFDIVKTLKTLWEDLRREDCAAEKKSELLKQICKILKGRVKEFVFAHDTVRIIECVMAEGSEEHRNLLFEELKGDIVHLSKSKYGKFFVLKLLKYGNKKQKEEVMKAFQGIVPKLMKHTEAAEVVECAFNECANATQRFQMIQEFFGSTYRHFKETSVHNLAELLKMKPESKMSLLNSMKEELLKVVEKSVVKHSLIHHVLLQFFLNCDPASRTELIESLCEVVPEILHTKDGSRVAMHCIWHGNHKHRKSIVKHMKTFVKKIAMEEHGHMVLLALFDCVDDTTIIEKVIIKELQENMLEVSQNVHGKKVLIYLLNPRDSHFFHPDVINILKSGDNNEFSKKNPEIRHQELKKAIAGPLTQLIIDNIADLYKNNAFCLFTVNVLKHTVGDKRQAYESIAHLAAEPYTSENKNVHIIENSGSFFMLKQLILNDTAQTTSLPEDKKSDVLTFSEVFVENIPSGVMKTWFHCNRGAFVLVNLIETEIPAVVNKVKDELNGCKSQLSKLVSKSKGAEILLEKLKKL